jgi:zinc and cadmium transporter
MPTLFWILLATAGMTLLSLSGMILLWFKFRHVTSTVLILVALSAGAMLGNVGFHLLPEIVETTEHAGLTFFSAMLLMIGAFVLSFLFELIFSATHCHSPSHRGEKQNDDTCRHRIKPFAQLILYSDTIHNFVDGLIIATSFMVSPSLGLTTLLAIALHEVPQELGDFAVLLHGGYTRSRALMLNLLSASTVIVGGVVGYLVTSSVSLAVPVLLPIAAGSFLYIASADLLPELKHEEKVSQTILHASVFFLGLLLMAGTAFLK